MRKYFLRLFFVVEVYSMLFFAIDVAMNQFDSFTLLHLANSLFGIPILWGILSEKEHK